MSDVFEGYERQYCELSANLSRKCNSAALLDGGITFYAPRFSFAYAHCFRINQLDSVICLQIDTLIEYE